MRSRRDNSELVPVLRFPEFQDKWEEGPISSFLARYSEPVAVDPEATYRQIGVRSHGRGIFHKDLVDGVELGNKKVFWVHPNAFIVNIVFAWEQAVAVTSEDEKGMIASHRFPMFVPLGGRTHLDFVSYFFKRPRGKYLLEIASPGGAGRNKTLGQEEFSKLKVVCPSYDEQEKIAKFLRLVDCKRKKLVKKRELFEKYKHGLMQRIFSRGVRFRKGDRSAFPPWQEKKASSIFCNHSNKKHNGNLPILAVTQDKGVVNRKEIGVDIKSSIESIRSYKLIEPGDFVISLRSFQGGIEYSRLMGISSPAYTVLKPLIRIHDDFYRHYFKRRVFIKRLAGTVIGIRDGKQISFGAFSTLDLPYPFVEEQRRIAEPLNVLDSKVSAISSQIDKLDTFKKGLLQKMFV